MADRYWVPVAGSATGIWDASTTTHWSATDGGSGGASAPTTADDAHFTANSGTGTVTLSSGLCQSLSSTGASGIILASSSGITFGDATHGGNVDFSGFGSIGTNYGLTFASGLTNSGAGWLLTAKTGMKCTSSSFSGGGKWKLGSAWNFATSTGAVLSVTSGTLDIAGNTVTTGHLSSTGNTTRGIIDSVGGGVVSVAGNGAGAVACTGTNLTISTGIIISLDQTTTTAMTCTVSGLAGAGSSGNPTVRVTTLAAVTFVMGSASCGVTATVGGQTLIFTNSATLALPSAASWQVRGVENGFVAMPGVAGNYASTPDATPLDITGDIDLRVLVAMSSWTPSSTQAVIAKWGTTVATQSYSLQVSSSGKLSFSLSDGTSVLTAASTNATGFAAGSAHWIRATWSRGSGVATFYTSSDGVNWTQLDPTGHGIALAAINNSSAPLEIGSISSGTADAAAGGFYRAQVYNGIAGTLVFDANFATKPYGATSFTESSTNAATVTLHGAQAQTGDGHTAVTSDSAGTAWTLSCALGTVWSTGVNFTDSAASGGSTFHAGAQTCSFVSNVTGWVLYGATFSAESDSVSAVAGSTAASAKFVAEIDGVSACAFVPAGKGQFMAEVDSASSLGGAPTAIAHLSAEIDALFELEVPGWELVTAGAVFTSRTQPVVFTSPEVQ